MSYIFACGESGCHALKIDDDARKYAAGQLDQWCLDNKRKTGEFPRETEKVKYYAAAYARYKNIAAARAEV